jgi:hypothetical protein
MATVGMPAEIERRREAAGRVGQAVEQPVRHIFEYGRDIADGCGCPVPMAADGRAVEDMRLIGHERVFASFCKTKCCSFLKKRTKKRSLIWRLR